VALIAGVVSLGGSTEPGPACASLLASLGAWAPSAESATKALNSAVFGRILVKLLPEDEFDLQPLALADGSTLLVADARIDNRNELAETLGADQSGMADAALLGLAWDRWGLSLFDRVLGDIALAVWDGTTLTLARSGMSLKPLFYHVGSKLIAFSSNPAGLHALQAKGLNFAHAGAIAGLLGNLGKSTMFAGVAAVRHGHAVRLTKTGEEEICLWRPGQLPIRHGRNADLAEGLRHELERAVRARLRRHHGRIGSQLSAGRDSSAVTATAAFVLAPEGERLVALTSAPSEQWQGCALRGRLGDESALAARTAALHPNVEHVTCRTRALPLVERLTRMHALHHSPLLNPMNLFWFEEMNRVAAERDVTVMLNGGAGNFGLSAGGIAALPDLLAENGFRAWLAAAARWGGTSPARWRNALNVTFGAKVPPPIYRAMLRATGRGDQIDLTVPLLRQPYRASAEAQLRETFGDHRPPRRYRDNRADMLAQRDNAEVLNLGVWGIDHRDPTGDRALIDYCLSLPASQWISADSVRPAFESAFAQLLPREVTRNPLRGQQSADIFDHVQVDEIAAAIRRHGRNPLVAELFDLAYVEGLLEQWASSRRGPGIDVTTHSIFAALSLSNFIDVHFPA